MGLFLLLYLAADLSAVGHAPDGVSHFPWNAAAALSFAMVARGGLGWLPAAAGGAVLARALRGDLWGNPLAALLDAALEVAACAIVANRLRPDLGRLRGVFSLFGATLSAAVLMAAGKAALAVAGGAYPWSALGLAGHVVLAQAVAILAVAPLVMADNLRRWLRKDTTPIVETVLQMGALAVIAWEVFGRFANEEVHFFYLLFLPVAWIATRHGHNGSALALAAIYLAPVASDRLVGHNDPAIVELQIRLGVLAVTSLLFGAMASERRSSEARMQARQTEIAHFQRLNVGWEMASALAHELNQPLTAAMNYTQAAQRLITRPEPDLDRAAAVMAKSVDQIERVGQTIHGLRDFMRKGALRLTANTVGDMADDALRLVQAEANAAGILLQSAGLQGLTPVTADKTQMVQVLVNLIRNAVQALAAGTTENPIVLVSGRMAETEVEVVVTDNGPGLPPHVLARLFEPFVTTKEAGMGLGLSISKSILEAHDGRLWVESPPHGGAAFHFTLPLAAKDMADA
jgi:signal transduction histidine kinase